MKKLWAPWRMEYIRESIIEKNEECIFCISSKADEDRSKLILHRSDSAFIVMNKFPYNNGHLLIAPYRHISNFEELNADEFVNIQQLLSVSIQAMKDIMHPQGFNIGLNLGRAAGAGIDDHIHYHILPRWNGDTNFLPVLGEVKVISEALDESYDRIKAAFTKIIG